MKKTIEDNFTGKNTGHPRANTPLRYLTATSIMSDDVLNNQGEKLGEVKEIMIDVTSGKVDYLVLECGGFLGIGEKFFAIPYSIMAIDTERECLVLNQDKETLENAPGFDKDHWPKTNDHSFDSSNAYWGSFMGPNVGGF
jgi:sporulation protein YlmC with PRC-barrel domain